MKEIRKIAVLTSGGDAPGMNAAVRAVVRTGLHMGYEMYGVKDGYRGLRDGLLQPLTAGSVGDIIQRGGTFLGSARLPEFADDAEMRQRCYKTLKDNDIGGLVVCGGDGSYRGAALMHRESQIRTIGIPGTIDNDLAYTDYTIGFDTAVNTSIDCINKLRDTMASHDRISVVEVMGRRCGDIAVYSGVAAGAEAILIPEINKSEKEWLDYIYEKIIRAQQRGKKYGIIVMAEGVPAQPGMSHFTPAYIANWLNENAFNDVGIKTDARGIVLGHLLRGGSPSAQDRILAAKFGEHAIKLLDLGASSRCVGIKNNQVVDVDIYDALQMSRKVDWPMIELADTLAQ